MKTRLFVFAVVLLSAVPLFAHRLDEYLQAIIVSLEDGQVRVAMRLAPGVAVSGKVIRAIDSNHDDAFSQAEQQRYAEKVLADLSINIDGYPVKPHLETFHFPASADIREGIGEIQIEFGADLPAGTPHRTLTIENHHEPGISVYLMNCLVPQDKNIQLIAQNRNANQSSYRLEYSETMDQDSSGLSWRSSFATALAPFTGLPRMYRLGMSHIAEGTDHLLFLIALLLPAPVLVVKSRWNAFATVRHSLLRIFRVVTAFTAGHSLTLALGASGVLLLPTRLVEVLIAFSIFVSAIHALRPLFPGREPFVAGAFGLIHGMAFATTLNHLGVGAWQRLASLVGFNLGIETMQLIVVAGVLPPLLLLSRTPAFAALRIGGGVFAGIASSGWISERLFGIQVGVDAALNDATHHAAWIAAALTTFSLLAWLSQRISKAEIGRDAMRYHATIDTSPASK